MSYTRLQQEYIDSVEGNAHSTAVKIIGELEAQLSASHRQGDGPGPVASNAADGTAGPHAGVGEAPAQLDAAMTVLDPPETPSPAVGTLAAIRDLFISYIDNAEVDTDGEGDCRRPHCPWCGWGAASDPEAHHLSCHYRQTMLALAAAQAPPEPIPASPASGTLVEAYAKLLAFKAYVHKRLDEMGIPVDPDSPHKAEGCRVGGRLDWISAALVKPAESKDGTLAFVTTIRAYWVDYRNHRRSDEMMDTCESFITDLDRISAALSASRPPPPAEPKGGTLAEAILAQRIDPLDQNHPEHHDGSYIAGWNRALDAAAALAAAHPPPEKKGGTLAEAIRKATVLASVPWMQYEQREWWGIGVRNALDAAAALAAAQPPPPADGDGWTRFADLRPPEKQLLRVCGTANSLDDGRIVHLCMDWWRVLPASPPAEAKR